MFGQAGNGITEKSPGEANTRRKAAGVAAHLRKPKRTVEELCADIPEEQVLVDFPEQEKFTADDRPMKCIGTDDVRIEPAQEPSRMCRRVHADPGAGAETGKADFAML